MSIALVLGGAASVWDDLGAALDMGEFDAVVACNDIGAAWPGPLDAWVSLHPEKILRRWLKARMAAGYSEPGCIIGHSDPPRSTIGWRKAESKFQGQIHVGSSGLFAAKYAIVDIGFSRAVVCGIPMQPMPHFFDQMDWTGYTAHRSGWKEALPVIKDRVRSMSGWTAELLGRPTADWIAGA